jgi:hypothetical protein
LILMLLLLASGFSPLVTARPGYRSGQENLSKRVFNPLTSVRASKAYQIESYFRNIQHHTQTLSEDLSIIAAAEQFDTAFQELNKAGASADAPVVLATDYRNEALPRFGHGGLSAQGAGRSQITEAIHRDQSPSRGEEAAPGGGNGWQRLQPKWWARWPFRCRSMRPTR